MILALFGQVHGDVARGVDQAMLERTVFDPETGQLLTGSLADYCLARAEAWWRSSLPITWCHALPTRSA
jgi:molybdopterin-binding aldehyde dehydrogenase-like protein